MTGRRLKGGRAALAGAVVVAALVPTAGPALGLGDDATSAVSVPQLQTQTQLPQTPDASVPVPQVPQVQTPSVPSTPQVGTPSVPSAPHVSAPSVSVPSTGQSSQSATGGGSSGGAAAQSLGPGAQPSRSHGSSRRAGRVSAQSSTPQARAHRRARERHVRAEVRRLSSCLSSLPATERRYLSLRAGLNGAPESRGEAADDVGIPRSHARDVERRGLRRLRSACGGGGGGGSTRAQTLAHTTTQMPTFQPTSLLVATGGSAPTEFVDQKELGKRGKQAVKGESATSSPEPNHNEGHPEAAVPSKPLSTASSDGIGAAWIAILAALALMAAVTMLALRSRRGGHTETVTAATAATGVPIAPPPTPAREPQPEPEPEADAEPEPARQPPPVVSAPPQPPEPHGRDYRKAARPAAMIASGILSFAARELMRRRRGGRRR
jgi:Sigma-70, region 4